MSDRTGPDSGELGLREEEMQTPEQRAELAEFRKLSDPTMDKYWVEGGAPFGLPREEVVARISVRRFKAVETADVAYDSDLLQDVQSIVATINETSGQHYYLGKYPLAVVEYNLALARGEDSGIDPKEIAYIAGEMDKYFKQSTGKTLAEWAKEYVQSHEEVVVHREADTAFFDLLERDYNRHNISLGNLSPILAEYIKNQGIDSLDPQSALGLLAEKDFVVPSEWSDEVAETAEGRDLLEIIGKIKTDFQAEEIADTLEANYADVTPEELKLATITVADILAVVSFNIEAPKDWDSCDEEFKALIKAVMSKLETKLGGKVRKSKGEPVVKFL